MQQLQRSNSLFGTLKSIVSSSIPWFGSANDLSDIQGKRKMAPVEEDESEEEGEHRAKRKRMHSPEPEFQQRDVAMPPRNNHLYEPQPQRVRPGYLDPPVEAFQRQSITEEPAQPIQGRAMSLAAADRLPSSGAYSRRTASPGPSNLSAQARPLTRTQSMDPPPRRRSAFEPATGRRGLTRDGSLEALRDRSRSPSRPFRMRTSMTPQPLGQGFGPSPTRPEREPSEPPPLAALIENPVFIRAPSQPPPDRQEADRRTPMTLGNVAKAQRTARPLKRSRSSLMLDDEPMAEDDGPAYPINAAEKVLRDLEVYKTPLLPTRLRESANVPDMFQTQFKKARVALMHDREHKPRLGTIDKSKGRDRLAEGQESPGVKPYAGRGGMKRLLARRRMEEEEEHQQARLTKLAVIEEADEEEERTEQPAPELEPESKERMPTTIGGREQSSLRVGRKRNNRNHIVRPQLKGRGRYAAIFDDEDEDSMVMDEESERERKMLEEAARNAPEFKPPPSFSFATAASAPPIQLDATAKEPPIAALPFSLSKPSAGTSKLSSPSQPAATKQPVTTLSAVTAAETIPTAAFAPLTPVLKNAPEITASLPNAVAAPSHSESQISGTVSEKSTSGIPNFFATSAVFNKPMASVSTQTTFSLVPPPSVSEEKIVVESVSTAPSSFSFGKAPEADKKEEASVTPAFFGGPTSTTKVAESDMKLAAPTNGSTAETPSFFGTTKSAFPTTTAASAAATAPMTSLFGTTPASSTPSYTKDNVNAPANGTSAFSFGAPAKPVEQPATQSSPFTFGAPPAKPAEQTTAAASSAPSLFSFGDAAKPAETATPPAPTPTLAPSPFTFGKPKTESAPAETKPADTSAPSSAPLSVFGASKPFAFGAAPPTPEPAKSPFTFGQPAAQPSVVSTPSATTPSIEAPKPIFGGASGFSFGQPSAVPTSNTEPPKTQSPFSFGTSSTPPIAATDKKPFSFGTPSPAPPATPTGNAGGSTLFSGTSGHTNITDATNKPFSFGTPTTPAAPTPLTPPKNGDSSMLMDESPLRGNGMDVNGGKPELPKLNGFAFGTTPAPSPFSQPTANASTPFSFGSGTPAVSGFGARPTETQPAEKPAFGGFGQTSTSTGFSFGQKAPEISPPTATATGFSFAQKTPEAAPAQPSTGFSFGQKAPETTNTLNTGFSFASPATPTAPAASFPFSAPQVARSTSFGQPPSATSTPSSPFGQTAPSTGFSFGVATPTSATAPSNPFSFNGSQPASPAGSNAGLPNSGGSAGFSFGTANAVGASPFGAAPSLPAAGGAPSFTIGAAPSNVAIARPIKKMPNRRGKR